MLAGDNGTNLHKKMYKTNTIYINLLIFSVLTLIFWGIHTIV